MVKKREYNYSKERIKELHGFARLLFNRPILKFLILVLIYFLLNNLDTLFHTDIPLRLILQIIRIAISIYFILVIVYLIRKWFSRITNPTNIFTLILDYALFILGIILIFSNLFSFLEVSHLGYIKYGICSDKFDSSMINSDTMLSREYFYFSTVTFFTVGYGDICPMGYAKLLAMIVAFTGHLVSVLIVALVINNYFKKKQE